MPVWPESSKSSSSNRMVVPAALAGLLSITFVGCVSSPSSRMADLETEVPSDWATDWQDDAEFDASAWTSDFDDPRLESIIKEALEYNFDLRAAVARLDASLALSRANRADIWPALSVSANGTKSRRSSASGVSQTSYNESYGINGRFSWEVDIWGKVRNGARADLADAEAAIGDFEAARLSIAGRVAKAWYAAVEANQQFELETRILEALTQSSLIVEENFSSGIARSLDVRLVRANLAASRSSLEQRRRSRDQAIRNLETLLGRYPKNDVDVVSTFPDLTGSLPAGLPSDLLLRRPDILAAERRLAAAEQRKYESSKARLPSIDLNLSRGTSVSDVADIFDFVESRIWTQSLTIAQTLFQGGRLKANYNRAIALYEENLANYSQTVLVAFREVENALSFQDSFTRDYDAAKVAASESVEAEKLAWDEYSSGLSDITTALDSVRRSITAQRAFIQVANQRIQSRIDLYLALGGGFELAPSPET